MKTRTDTSAILVSSTIFVVLTYSLLMGQCAVAEVHEPTRAFQEVLPDISFELPVLSELERQEQESSLSEIEAGGFQEARDAIERLASSEVRFARNCMDMLERIQSRRSRSGAGASEIQELFSSAAEEIPSLPEGGHKNFVVDRFFTFREKAELSVEDRLAFDFALQRNLFSSEDGISIIPEYGGMKIIGVFAEYLTNQDAEIRNGAADALSRIGVQYSEMRDAIAALLQEKLPEDEAERALYAMNSQARPEFNAIKASDYEQLKLLSAEDVVELMVSEGAHRRYLQHLLIENEERVRSNYEHILRLLKERPEIHLGWNAPLRLAIPAAIDSPLSERGRVDAVLDFYQELIEGVDEGNSSPMWLPDALYRCIVLMDERGRTRKESALGYGADRTIGLLTELLQRDNYRTAAESAKRMRELAALDAKAAERISIVFEDRMKAIPEVGPGDLKSLRSELTKGIEETALRN